MLTDALALLTLGLVRPWGEIVPVWVPRLGGRRIPPAAVVVPATAGGMKALGKRWKIGLLIGGYVALVLTMVWFSLPRALEGARGFQQYQESQTRSMIEAGRRAAEERDAAAGGEATK